jgi:hypothetical protein
MAATDDRAAHPCCPIGFLKLARTAVMRVCVVSWAPLGLPSNKEHAARADGAGDGVRRTAFTTPSFALPLGHPRGNLRDLNFLSGQLPSPRRLALGLPLGKAGEVESEGGAHRPGSHAGSPHFT